ncbi:uncharacterized protein LOC141647200 isoform X2 [Silene latifolia]|uniref:uncharacterized protein LOC141647200 isoform X2 n=1 Tax=Silene latifolia TaxID=37657 RepID=UPI003D77D101
MGRGGGAGGVIGFVVGDDNSFTATDTPMSSRSIVTRSMSSRLTTVAKPCNMRRRNVKSRRTKVKDKLYRPSKMPKMMETKDVVYKIPGSVGARYCYETPEEYAACQKENAYLEKDPGFFQQQNELESRQLFAMIQKNRKEMADYELVEAMAVKTILVWGAWVHMNFKAKHKDAEVSSTAIYFAEVNMASKEVNFLTKMDIDLSADTCAYKRCSFCYHKDKDLPVAGIGCVYHPVDAKLVLG